LNFSRRVHTAIKRTQPHVYNRASIFLSAK
jgi:hypothetical protein